MPVLGLLGALLSAPRLARASSGVNTFGTIGLGIAVGTVLGASTLPFYDQPGDHLVNLAYGAGAGILAGIVAAIVWNRGATQDGDEASLGRDERILDLSDRRSEVAFQPSISRSQYSFLREGTGASLLAAAPPRQGRPAPTFWMPLVSLTW